jgi:tripartite-type tricarboxylate transporter receptor subunit TctC
VREFVKCLSLLAACCPFLLSGPAANADEFPERPIELVVGTSPGGGTDTVARIIAQALAEKWGQAVVVANRPGADFRLAAGYVAHAKPDGYTMLLMVIDLALPDPPGIQASYDPLTAFIPVALAAKAPTCLSVNAESPVNSLKEFLAMAQAGTVNFAVNQNGGPGETGWRRLLAVTKTPMQFLHYQGASVALVAVLNNEAQGTISSCATMLPHIQSGKLKVLAISEKVDEPLLASVPTFAEASAIEGYDGQGSNWYGFAVAAGTPDAIVAKMRKDITEALQSPDVKQKLLNQLIYAASDYNQDEFPTFIKNEIVRWDTWTKETEALSK